MQQKLVLAAAAALILSTQQFSVAAPLTPSSVQTMRGDPAPLVQAKMKKKMHKKMMMKHDTQMQPGMNGTMHNGTTMSGGEMGGGTGGRM